MSVPSRALGHQLRFPAETDLLSFLLHGVGLSRFLTAEVQVTPALQGG